MALLQIYLTIAVLVFEISNEEKEILLWRTEGLIIDVNSSICAHHYSLLIKYYGINFKSCCDPSKKHKRNVKSSLRSISMQMAKDAKNKSGVSLVPGQKICSNCRKSIFQGSCDADFENDHASNDEDQIQQTDLPDITCVEEQTDPELTYAVKEDLNLSITSLNLTPLKLKSLSERSKLYGKRKVADLTSQVKTKITKVLKVPPNHLNCDQRTDV